LAALIAMAALTMAVQDPRTAARPSLLDLPRSVAFYVVFYGGTLLMLMIAIGVLALVPRWTRGLCDNWSRFHRLCTRTLLGIRVRIEGEVPGGGFLVVGKHESMFEAIDMPTLLRFPSVFAKVELMRMPMWGTIARNYGLVAVERDAGAKALRTMIAAARELVAQGRPLVIFAEGTRVPHGSEPPLQAGFAGLYKLLNLPVIPLAVDSGPFYHRWIKHGGSITYRFGEPIPPGLPRDEAETRVHAAMNALNREDGA